MKKMILTCALLTSVSILSFAQSAQTTQAAAPAQPNAAPAQQPPAPRPQMQPEQMAERRAQMYKKQYELNDEQYKGVYEAELDFVKQVQQIRASGKQATQPQMQQLAADKDAKFKKVMTPEQYTKYTAARQPGAQPPAPAPVAK